MAASNKFAQPFKDYEILGRLGSGGMGTVFKARRRSDGEIVALKVLRPSLSRNDRHVQRLRREAAFGIRFDHPNLVKIHGLYEEGGYHYLVMQYVDGKSLKSLLQTWGRFPEDQVIEMGIQMASALAHSHGHGVIHRDVKPGNIIVDEEGHAMLTDLGLAKGDTDITLTQDGSTVGTPQYMSPEQAQDPRTVGVEGDLYSLGATLYHMSVGQPPFDGESIGQVITKLLHQKADSADSLNPEVGKGLNLVLGRLLLKDPELRYRSAEELLADLRLIQAGDAPQVDPRMLERDVILVDRPWYRQPVSLALSGLLILISLLAIFFFPRERDLPPRTLEELRPQIQQLAQAGAYKDALRLLYSAEVGEAEQDGKDRYREDLLEDFDRRFRLFLKEMGQKRFRTWLDDQGLADWESAYLDGYVPEQIYGKFRYTPDRLPEPVQKSWQAWRARVRTSMALTVENQARDLVLDLDKRYARDWEAKVAGHLDEKSGHQSYREALKLVKRFQEDPWLVFPEKVQRKPVLPIGLSYLLDDFREERAKEMQRIRRQALSSFDTWKRDMKRLRNGVRLATNAGEFQVALDKLDQLRKSLMQARKRFRGSLPLDLDFRSAALGFDSDLKDLDSNLQRAEELSARSAAEEERKRYLIKQDLAHDMLAKTLDFVEARRVVRAMRLQFDMAKTLRTRFLKEIQILEGFVSWTYTLLETQSAARRTQDWSILGKTRRRDFLKLDRSSAVMLHFAKEAGEVDKIPFWALDRIPLVEKIQQELAHGSWKKHREGMGLFLYFGDEFEKAQVFLGDFDAVQAERQARRRLWISEEKGNRENALRSRMLEIEDHLMKEHLDLARDVLQTIRKHFAGSQALAKAQFGMRDLERRIQDLEKKKTLESRIPISLRHAAVFSSADANADNLGTAERVRTEIDFRRQELFPRGLQDWRQGPQGLQWVSSPDEDSDTDWRKALRLSLPIYDVSSPFEHRFQIDIPANGEAPVALELRCSGTPLLFVQLPGHPVLLVPDPPGDLTAALKAALKLWKAGNPQSVWYLLPGLRYEIVVKLGKVRAGRRILQVQVDGRAVLAGVTKVKERPQTKTMFELRSLGPVRVSQIEVSGRLRR